MIGAAFLAALLAAGATAPATKPASGVHYLYLIRHGHYELVRGDDDGGKAKLDALGHIQARLVGERLAKLPLKLDRLVSSRLTRAVETSDDMAKLLRMTPSRDADLNECASTTNDPSYTRDDTKAEIAECDAARISSWERWFRPTPERDTFDVLVCHGNVIRWMVRRAVGADPKDWPYADIGNGSLTVIAVRPDGRTRLVAYSDTGHIPPEQQTWTGRGPGYSKP
jgi:serine/threonine-protein phosphatase PGAM5